jgi:hypothetical protein
MLIVLISACSSSDMEEGATHKQAELAVYVYAPEQAAVKKKASLTRGDVGEVDAITNEATIKSLQIWIYESESGNYVGYFNTEDVTALNQGQGTTYQIPVTDEFAADKPNVDVYVMANVTNANCGVGTLDKETTRAALLDGAKIANGKFGLEEKTRSVPDDGLPFAGKLTTQPVVGDAPVLRVGTLSSVSTVSLTRAVSKLRFVFSKTTGEPTVKITSIKMNVGMIPNVEYLFKVPVSMTYNTEAKELLIDAIDDVAEAADPTNFLYLGQEAQEYEELIYEAANKQEPEKPEVTIEGPIYLRESDRQLEGTITYTIDGGDEESVTFQMHQAGDFSRNHTWIVYAYYAGSGGLRVQSLYVKDWSGKEMPYNFYNW